MHNQSLIHSFFPAISLKLFEGNSEDSEDIIKSGTRFNSALPNGELVLKNIRRQQDPEN